MSLWERVAQGGPQAAHPKAQAPGARPRTQVPLPPDLFGTPPQPSAPVQQYPVHTPVQEPVQPQPAPEPEPLRHNKSWVQKLNPLDWLPGWGTYISTGAAVALSVAETVGYPIPPTAYAIIAAFAGARLRRAVSRPSGYRGQL